MVSEKYCETWKLLSVKISENKKITYVTNSTPMSKSEYQNLNSILISSWPYHYPFQLSISCQYCLFSVPGLFENSAYLIL